MKGDRDLDKLLRSMDAAGQGSLPNPSRAQRDLSHILGTGRSQPTPSTDGKSPAPSSEGKVN